MNSLDQMTFKDLDNMTYGELTGNLIDLIYLGYEQYSLYTEYSVESKRILNSQQIVFKWFNLLKDGETEPRLIPKKDEIFAYVKQEIVKEQSRRLKEIELSTKFLNGGMECTIQA